MQFRSLLASSLPLIISLHLVQASVTVYTTYSTAVPSPTTTACYGANACDQNIPPLVPLPAPGQGLTQSVPIQLNSGGMEGLGNPVKPDFMGFSIELSIVNQISELQ
jgi:hypothetical protein